MFTDPDSGDTWLTLPEACDWLDADVETVVALVDQRILTTMCLWDGGAPYVRREVIYRHGQAPVAVEGTIPHRPPPEPLEGTIPPEPPPEP